MDTVRLAHLIDRKHEVLRQLLLLAQRQYQVVSQGEMGTLISILAAKQRMLNELQTVEAELAPFRRAGPRIAALARGGRTAACPRGGGTV